MGSHHARCRLLTTCPPSHSPTLLALLHQHHHLLLHCCRKNGVWVALHSHAKFERSLLCPENWEQVLQKSFFSNFKKFYGAKVVLVVWSESLGFGLVLFLLMFCGDLPSLFQVRRNAQFLVTWCLVLLVRHQFMNWAKPQLAYSAFYNRCLFSGKKS